MRTITTRQARQADALAIERLAIPSIVLMENAALHASRIAGGLLGTAQKDERQRVVILAGGGNNGGDGYAMARQLRTVGHDIHIIALRNPQRLKGDAAINARIAMRMKLPVTLVEQEDDLPGADRIMTGAFLIVDALLGTGFTGQVRQPMAGVIRQCNAHHASGAKVLAVDVPSGLDADTGHAAGDAIEADVTVTFVALKQGFSHPSARRYTGQVIVRDIGAPADMLLPDHAHKPSHGG